MIKRRNRLSSGDVERLVKSGKMYHSPLFVFRISPNQLDFPRFAVVVPKKVEKTAVGRNRNKRRIMNIFEKKANSIVGIDVFCQVKKDTRDISFNELEQVLQYFLVQNRFIR